MAGSERLLNKIVTRFSQIVDVLFKVCISRQD
jgi:hypothetical protein